MSGWFAVKHGAAEHEAFGGDFAKFGLFVWMVDNAAYKPTKIDIAGRPYIVPRGALCFSQRFLATRARMSVKALRTFLATLERHGIITVSVVKVGHARETQRTQLTFCNYDHYQLPGNNRETTGKQPGNKEEQENTKQEEIQSPSETGADAPLEVSPITSALWGFGKPYLERHGVKNPGGIIGRWLRDSGNAIEVLTAIETAMKAGTGDPVPFITATLSKSSKGGRNGSDIAKRAAERFLARRMDSGQG